MSDVEDRVEAPRWLAEHAEAFAASGAAPAVPRLAATVVLLRDAGVASGSAGPRLEVYVQRRAATMAFAPGMYAFPGGSVDRTDYQAGHAHASPARESGPAHASPARESDPAHASPARESGPDEDDGGMAARTGLPPESMRAVLRAAVRELAEEAGVQLPVAAMRPWARWLTPEFEPRRFDTFFFVARMPPGEYPRGDDAREWDHAVWLPLGEAVRLPMLPPTRYTLRELARFTDVEAVLAAATGRDVSAPVRPVIEVDADGAWLRLA